MTTTRLAVLIATGAVAALVAGLAGSGAVLGMITVALIVLLAVLGLPEPRRRPVWLVFSMTAWGIAFCVLIAFAYRLHDPSAALVTLGGFPVATAMLVYGTTPVGIAMGLIYALAFDRHILPRERQRDFLARFGPE